MTLTVKVTTGEDITTFQVYKRQLQEMRTIGGKNEPYRSILDRLLETYHKSNRKVLPAE